MFCATLRLHLVFRNILHDVAQKNVRKPMSLSLIQRRWFSPVLLGCYDILMDVIVCDTLWYLIRPIGRILKIAFCEM